VRAWEGGGAAALEVLEDAGGPVPERALWQLAAAWRDTLARPALRRAGNRWTVAGTGGAAAARGRRRWWPYRKQGGRRWPAGSAACVPDSARGAALDDAAGGAEPRGRPGRRGGIRPGIRARRSSRPPGPRRSGGTSRRPAASRCGATRRPSR